MKNKILLLIGVLSLSATLGAMDPEEIGRTNKTNNAGEVKEERINYSDGSYRVITSEYCYTIGPDGTITSIGRKLLRNVAADQAREAQIRAEIERTLRRR